MIYRIRIMKQVDGKMVFDHYATDEEMLKLKVTPDGKVEEYKLAIYKDIPPDGDVKADVFWFDVSDTHFVEWGAYLTSTPIYENDIILIHDGDGIYYEAKEGIFALMEFYTNYLVNGSPYCEIVCVGNVWKIPNH